MPSRVAGTHPGPPGGGLSHCVGH